MKYDTAEAFRAALDQRIRNEATTTKLPVMRLRKRVAFERFLARLAIAEPGNWVLKGAFALELRLGVRTRATKDIDLAGADDEQTATARLIAAQAINLHDHFNFDVARTAALDQAEAFRAVRYRVTAEVAGRRFEQFPVDVALNEQPTAPSEHLPIPSLLDFADIQPIEMPVIALEQHIAEKVHAYTATYGPQEQQSTRIKDLIDILLIADLAAPHADRLHASLAATFSRRGRQPSPPRSRHHQPRGQGPTPAPQQTSGYQPTSGQRTPRPPPSSTRSSPAPRPAAGTPHRSAGPPPEPRPRAPRASMRTGPPRCAPKISRRQHDGREWEVRWSGRSHSRVRCQRGSDTRPRAGGSLTTSRDPVRRLRRGGLARPNRAQPP